MTKDYLERQFKNYHEITGDVVTPQMFGAVGDGVTDDTTAILAMFASGKNVFLTEGTYLVNKQININHNIIVDGAGKLNAVIKADQNFDYSVSNTPVFMRVYADATIKNIGVITEYDLSLPYHENEMTLFGAMKAASVVIDSCWFKAMRPDNGATKGINLVWGRGTKVLEVRNCLLQNFSNGKTGGCLWHYNWSDAAVDGENSIVADRIIFDNNIIEHTCWDEAIGVWTYNDDTKPVWKNVQITNNFITHDSFVENVEARTNDNLISVNASTTQAAWNYGSALIQGNTLISNYDCRCFIKARCNMGGLTIKDNYLADNSIVRNSYYENKQIRVFLIDSCYDAKVIGNTFLSSAPRFDNFSPMFVINGHANIEGNTVQSLYGYFTLIHQNAVVSGYETLYGASVKHISGNNITTPNFSIYVGTASRNTIKFTDNTINNSSTSVYISGYSNIDWYIERNKFSPNSVMASARTINGGSFHFIDNLNYTIKVYESSVTTKWDELEFRGAQQAFQVASTEGAVPYSDLTDAILSNLANIVTVYRTDGGDGSGDMLASVYDPDGTVADAGGIVDYVVNNGIDDALFNRVMALPQSPNIESTIYEATNAGDLDPSVETIAAAISEFEATDLFNVITSDKKIVPKGNIMVFQISGGTFTGYALREITYDAATPTAFTLYWAASTSGSSETTETIAANDPFQFAWAAYTPEIVIGDGAYQRLTPLARKTFTGTLDEWDALPPYQKAMYDFIATPDEAVEDIADAVIDGDMRAVTSNAVAKTLCADNAGAHNGIYRGKYLGSSVTAEQYAQISAGTFRDLFIGDYWTIGGINYRIAAFDYWLKTGDTRCTIHHVILVPDTNLYTAAMNSSDVTTGGYVSSAMHTSNLTDAKTTINSAFGSAHILNHRELFTNSVTDDTASGWNWYDSNIDLMNECMVYGHNAWGSHSGYETGIDRTQLPLFAMAPEYIANGAGWWLRSIASSTYFALVISSGGANHNLASSVRGVRPAFAIIG